MGIDQKQIKRNYYAANKDEINKRRRELYAVNKVAINRRRRELRAEKKRLLERSNQVGDSGEPPEVTISTKETSNQVGESGEPSGVTIFTKKKRVNVNKSNACEIMQCSPFQNSSFTTSMSSYVDINNIDEYSVMSEDPSVEMQLESTIEHSYIVPLSERRTASVDISLSDPRTLILPKVPPCKYCKAYKFFGESASICCSKGQICLAESTLPSYLVQLITGVDAKSKEFQNMIRTYNNHFAFTSIGMSCDEQYQHRDHGVYTVRVLGQVHHYLNDLIPQNPSNKMKGVQFYFYDPQHQAMNRMNTLPRLDTSIVENLVELMEPNPYAAFLKHVSTLDNIDDYHIVIRSDPGLDQRTYNKPTCSEVAGVWLENETDDGGPSELWDIRVYTKSGRSHIVQYYYGCYDPLQYVLMFPHGEPGWHTNIPRVGYSVPKKTTSRQQDTANYNSFEDILSWEREAFTGPGIDQSRPLINNLYLGCDEMPLNGAEGRKRKMVSCREYYVYKFQDRPDDKSYIVRFGRLFQQYVIDNYVKIESMRLDFLRNNQKRLRREHYQGVVDSVISGVLVGGKVGRRIYLPPTFIGGPRDLRHRYLDSMALVQHFGRPDIFLTITCNPNWPEIKERLQPEEEAQNRPDLCARVFKAKLGIINDKIMSGEVFGKVSSVVHVVEFQKRGLPHAHFLIILRPEHKYMTPEAYDRIVSSELPDKRADPYMYSLVVKHMMHGPCGELNSSNVCMRDGKCKNHYPKNFTEYTTHGKGSYPNYRRRNDMRTAKVRGHLLDNRWVIPYNPTLLVQFNCHMNVEICCDIRAVKYLYKYVHKGHDKVMFRIASDNPGSNIDEISNYQNARWVSPVESAWRIYGFPLFGMYPAVLQLQIHLPNFQTVQFEEDADLEEFLQNERLKRTMLTGFFHTNATDPEAKKLKLLYKEFPQYYVWHAQLKIWTKRKRGNVIGRLCIVNPMETERYYLRILLNNVRCPTSFDSLLMVQGVLSSSFQEAAHRRGLLHNDDDLERAMEEASIYRMPFDLRRLFATLLHYCKPSDPKKLFEKFYDHMAEDFKRAQTQLNLSEYDILYKVLQGINDTLESLGRDVNQYHLVSFTYTATEDERYTREIVSEKNIPIPEEDLYAINELNEKQKEAFDIIFHYAMSEIGGAFFVDGPGGTGKSFLYKVLLAHIRSKGFIGIIVASSGIASSEFLGGRTAHNRFKIPIDAKPGAKCQISYQSSEAELIRNSKIIIWDEAPMADKTSIYAVHLLLQDLCDNNEEPFGGKLVVFGGDFRQVLPVIKGGGRTEQVDASIVSSTLWKYFRKLRLTDNMRARFDPDFVDFLMRIGNGEEPANERHEIEIPEPMLIKYTSLERSVEDLISYVYPDLNLFQQSPFEMMQRIILCPKNDFVNDVNSKLIRRIPGDEVVYISDDRAKNISDQGDYVDYLNSLEPKGLPQHKLVLKVNCPVILLRNINPVEGLCNGTRLICNQLTPNLVGAVIATGQFKGKHVWIPRIPLEPNPSDNKYLIPFVRRQFPLRLCFAMTINKAQGQTLDCVGIYLRQPVFSHGQLYVALSRAKTGNNVRVLIIPAMCADTGTKYTTNVVYDEVLVKANIT